MSTVDAVVISKPGQVELQPVSLKALGAGDVRIQTMYTSISAGTERMLLAGQMPHPMLALPVIPGYETVGRIIEAGNDVAAEMRGKWVYIGGAQCYEGINAAWGGQAAEIVAAADRVIPLDGVAPRHGVLLALAATALHGIDLLDLQASSRMLVLGQGPVGQLAARLAMAQGVWTAVTDRNPKRLANAAGSALIDVSTTPLTEAIKEPVEFIVEATGSMTALKDALPLLSAGGTILLLGYYQNLDLPYMPLFLKEARLLTAKEWAPGDLQRCRDMIAAGKLDVGPMLTHTFPIQKISAAYDTALNDTDCLKCVLEWDA